MSSSLVSRSPVRFEERESSGKVCPCCLAPNGTNWLQAPDRFHGRPAVYQLFRCAACEMVWLDNPPPPADMGQHYGSYYDRMITAAGENDNKRWLRRREKLRKYKQSGVLLDLGCSSGSFLASLRNDPWELHGIEMSSAPARKAEARSGGRVFVGDILDAPFAAGTFDAITCYDVFEHLYQPREVLEKVRHWLKPDGIFFAFMPNIYSGEATVFGSYWYGLELPRHLSHFSPKSLRSLAESCGFRDIAIATTKGQLVEYSTRYLFDHLCHALGIYRLPLAEAKNPSLAWKLARKAYRVSLLPVICALISLAGEGEVIEMVLRKDADYE